MTFKRSGVLIGACLLTSLVASPSQASVEASTQKGLASGASFDVTSVSDVGSPLMSSPAGAGSSVALKTGSESGVRHLPCAWDPINKRVWCWYEPYP
jgi:hypothetical protein